MAIGNEKFMEECFPKHSRMGTARMKNNKVTEEEARDDEGMYTAWGEGAWDEEGMHTARGEGGQGQKGMYTARGKGKKSVG